MPRTLHRLPAMVLLLLTALLPGSLARAARPTGGPAGAGGPAGLEILKTVHGAKDEGTIWRFYETWQSDVAAVDGKLVTVDIFDPRVKDGQIAAYKGWGIKAAKHALGSPFPADSWRQADFDDTSWLRHPGPFANYYRSLAQIALRGKFQVNDPARAGELSLRVKFQGGAVAYLNGKEIGRAGLPTGKLDNATLADPYPHETYVESDKNNLLATPSQGNQGRALGSSENFAARDIRWDLKDQAVVDRYKQRGRTLDVKVPANLLQRGVNVLAIEVHRAPADPIMFTAADLAGGNNGNISACWNRCSLEDISLTAPPSSAGAIVPNWGRPDGLQVWNENILPSLSAQRYGDPAEPVRPLKLFGLKNGAYSGQVLVGSRKALSGVQATVTDLKQGAATIPATAIQVSYPSLNNDALLPAPQPGAGNVQPVWVTVNVPRQTPPGVYRGTLNVGAGGASPVAVPVEMNVVGDWVLPNADDFVTFIGVHESADSVAMQYNVPLWSEDHWKHLDKVYELLAQIGAKDIYLTAVAKTHLANEQSMVRWIKQPDGSYKPDFAILERYLDTALKHVHKPRVVCLYLHDYGFRIEQSKQGGDDHAGGVQTIKPCVTVWDPATGKASELNTPAWGTPEARAFWKPVVDGVKALLAKRGLEKDLMFGMGANNWALRECVSDLKTLYPDIRWVNRTHFFTPNVGDGPANQKAGLAAVVGGVICLFYDPEDGADHAGWRVKRDEIVINFPRLGNVAGAVLGDYLASYRVFSESCLLSGGARWRSVPLVQGIGHIGADFWPVLKDPRGGPPKHMGNRYVFWHSLSISDVIQAILAPGPQGPVGTTRHQMMRESLQEAEVRVYVQNALMDNSARLGADLVQRCKDLCNQRNIMLRYYSTFSEPRIQDDYAKVFDQARWDELSLKLDQAAGDVCKALGK